ncbi:hypothetical protein DV735_g5878, partial [Chaetothyriales sp. CBS 134920]
MPDGRYYQPWLQAYHTARPTVAVSRREDGFTPQNSQDRALTAFAQLGALRLAAKRCVITLIDSKNQYVLAEATRSLSLMDDARHADGDALWMGNSVFPRGQGISCEALSPPPYTAKGPGEDEFTAPAQVILDLAHDERFKTRAFTGAGGIHFYAGVPMTTRLGHTIGVYSITHDQARPPLNAQELRTMVDMATIAVNHLEVTRNERARARGERMIRGIATFIADSGASEEVATDTTAQPPFQLGSGAFDDGNKVRRDSKDNVFNFMGFTISDMNAAARDQFPNGPDKSASPQKTISRRTLEPKSPFNSAPSAGPLPNDAATGLAAEAASMSAPTPRSRYLAVFDRAARILRKCMGADGVAFVDASAANLSRGASHGASDKASHPQGPYSNSRPRAERTMSISWPQPEETEPLDHGHDSSDLDDQPSSLHFTSHPSRRQNPCEIIAMALSNTSQKGSFQVPEHLLRRTVRRYPHGKVYTLGDRAHLAFSSDSSELAGFASATLESSTDPSQRRHFHKKTPLLTSFPDAKTIVFLPLWDFAMARWNSVAIVWCNSTSGLVNIQDDLSYLTAFGKTIMNEIARLNLAVADTAKGTFLANISHELRSPLHGILGSIEFLHDSPLDDFQSSMVISVETCGKTLLDTVEHVLDSAKLHNLSKRTRDEDGGSQASNADSLTRHFDLAMVVEEAVEAVYSGQVFRAHHAVEEGLSLPPSRKPRSKQQKTKQANANSQLEHLDAIRLTLNIYGATNWQVTSQPGAVRRVVMNLLGNSLKYTERGSIDVSLEIDHSRDQDDDACLHSCITVTDTGKGMGDDFIKNYAFTAFSQEDSLASGTGLGLSIIRKIVDSLGGKIDLRSQKGLGTQVKVWLSLPIDKDGVAAAMPTPKGILHEVQSHLAGMSLCMLSTPCVVHQNLPSPVPTLCHMPTVEESVRNLVAQWFSMNWFSMKVFDQSPMAGMVADLFIYTEPPPIEQLLQHRGNDDDRDMAPVIIICQNAFQAGSLRAKGLHDIADRQRIIEIIVQPVGPQKLARVFHRCLQRMKKVEDSPVNTNPKSEMVKPRKSDDIVVLPRQARPNLGRSAASLDTIATNLTARSSERPSPSPLRHRSVTVRSKKMERYGQDSEESTSRPDAGTASPLPRVLVVDDNPINLKLLETMVSQTKHPYESARDGRTAVELYQKAVSSGGRGNAEARFRYILMDISMPVMNGWQAAHAIRQWEVENQVWPPVKIFAITGFGEGETAAQKNQFKQAGFDKVLSKPVRFKDLSSFLV